MMLYAISMAGKNKKYKPFALAFAGIIVALALTLILLFVVYDQKYGRTGLAELIPLEAMFAFLYLENHTNYFETEAPVKEKIKEKVV